MFSRRAGMFFGVVSIAVLLVFIFRSSLLESVSGFLICPDELGKADVMVVLSGGAFDRGNYAAKLFEEGYTSGIYVQVRTPYPILRFLE